MNSYKHVVLLELFINFYRAPPFFYQMSQFWGEMEMSRFLKIILWEPYPISEHADGVGTNISLVTSPDGAQGQEQLCWRGPRQCCVKLSSWLAPCAASVMSERQKQL
jgi:hypothetical protein